jgi:hypothetical protein
MIAARPVVSRAGGAAFDAVRTGRCRERGLPARGRFAILVRMIITTERKGVRALRR